MEGRYAKKAIVHFRTCKYVELLKIKAQGTKSVYYNEIPILIDFYALPPLKVL